MHTPVCVLSVLNIFSVVCLRTGERGRGRERETWIKIEWLMFISINVHVEFLSMHAASCFKAFLVFVFVDIFCA